MKRSDVMRRVRSTDTKPELRVRRLLHAMGYRYRLHDKRLPGQPDIVFKKRSRIIFVHGCFWHGHDCARGARIPKNNRDYWITKISRNQERDASHRQRLEAEGWKVLVLWECELKDEPELQERLRRFLET